MTSAAAASTGNRRSRNRTSHALANVDELKQDRVRREFEEKQQQRLRFARDDPKQFLLSLGMGSKCPASAIRQLSVEVLGHEEKARCTYYQMKCTLRGPGDQ